MLPRGNWTTEKVLEDMKMLHHYEFAQYEKNSPKVLEVYRFCPACGHRMWASPKVNRYSIESGEPVWEISVKCNNETEGYEIPHGDYRFDLYAYDDDIFKTVRSVGVVKSQIKLTKETSETRRYKGDTYSDGISDSDIIAGMAAVAVLSAVDGE